MLSYFDEEWGKDDVIKFIDILLSCRYLFDKYIIKSSTLDLEYEHWTLRKIIKINQKVVMITKILFMNMIIWIRKSRLNL